MNKKAVSLVFAVFFVAGVIILAPLHARAGGKFDVEKKIAAAKTAADHEAIAAYFDKQAAAAKAKASMHEEMGASYKKVGGSLIEKLHLDDHCDKIKASYEAIAKENSALAEAHRAMAKEAGH